MASGKCCSAKTLRCRSGLVSLPLTRSLPAHASTSFAASTATIPASKCVARSSPNHPGNSRSPVDPPGLPPPRDRKHCRGVFAFVVVVVVDGSGGVGVGVVGGAGGGGVGAVGGGGRSPAPKTSWRCGAKNQAKTDAVDMLLCSLTHQER